MAYSRPATVRSHRRGGPRRRLRVAPWLVITMVIALVGAGLGSGYVWLVRQACSGQVEAEIVASPATASILEGLARDWASGEPSVEGTCASVNITARDSAEVALFLQNQWDAKANGPAPDVWVPQSTAWVRKAAVDDDAERIMPELQPSIARSPTVMAMPRAMAEALGWPAKQVTWAGIIANAVEKKTWAEYGQPDWGPFRLGMTNPATSTAGLLALTAILDGDDDEFISDAEQENMLRLTQAITVSVDRTEQILTEFSKLSAREPAAGLRYISAFPALEQDVLDHNLRNPEAPLVAIYPENGSIEADHPFLVLNADWASDDAQRVATDFLAFVRGQIGERQILDAGFRDPNRVPGKGLTQENGLAPEITTLPRAVLLPESVARTQNTWTALTRPTNILLVMDVSGSMLAEVPGTGKNRLELAKEAAKEAVALFSEDARVGLWMFSSGLSGRTDYRTVAPLDRLGDGVGGDRTRRDQMMDRIDSLVARGDTGLYDTTAAAQKFLLDNFKEDAVNLVVLLTDGKNEDPTGGLSFDALKEQLVRNNSADRRVSVATVGFGDAADYAALQQISQLTGGIAFASRDAFDINQVLLTAIFSDL